MIKSQCLGFRIKGIWFDLVNICWPTSVIQLSMWDQFCKVCFWLDIGQTLMECGVGHCSTKVAWRACEVMTWCWNYSYALTEAFQLTCCCWQSRDSCFSFAVIHSKVWLEIHQFEWRANWSGIKFWSLGLSSWDLVWSPPICETSRLFLNIGYEMVKKKKRKRWTVLSMETDQLILPEHFRNQIFT